MIASLTANKKGSFHKTSVPEQSPDLNDELLVSHWSMVFSFKPETIGSTRAARLCANQNADREHKKEQSRRRGEKKNKSTFLVP